MATSSNPHDLKVGQKLYFVNTNRPHPEGSEVTVAKIGRQWAELSPSRFGRIDLKTLTLDSKGYASRGRCWLSEEQFKEAQNLMTVWNEFHSAVGRRFNHPPKGVTVEDIMKARQILDLL